MKNVKKTLTQEIANGAWRGYVEFAELTKEIEDVLSTSAVSRIRYRGWDLHNGALFLSLADIDTRNVRAKTFPMYLTMENYMIQLRNERRKSALMRLKTLVNIENDQNKKLKEELSSFLEKSGKMHYIDTWQASELMDLQMHGCVKNETQVYLDMLTEDFDANEQKALDDMENELSWLCRSDVPQSTSLHQIAYYDTQRRAKRRLINNVCSCLRDGSFNDDIANAASKLMMIVGW